MTKKKKNTDLDWLFDEHGNLVKRPAGHSHDIDKKKDFKYHIIETHDDVEPEEENED